MNKIEAKGIIKNKINEFREKPYSELIEMIDSEPVVYEIEARSGALYQIEFQSFWDDKPNDDVRVIGSIDNGKWSAFKPLSEDFIKNSENEFMGE